MEWNDRVDDGDVAKWHSGRTNGEDEGEGGGMTVEEE